MFEQADRYSEGARDALGGAREEARRLNHPLVGTEHLLLGLTRADGAATDSLIRLGLQPAAVRAAVEARLGPGRPLPGGEPGMTPRAGRAMQLAAEESARLGREMVGPEHLLLGLLREGDGIAAAVLTDLGVTLESARAQFGGNHPGQG